MFVNYLVIDQMSAFCGLAMTCLWMCGTWSRTRSIIKNDRKEISFIDIRPENVNICFVDRTKKAN